MNNFRHPGDVCSFAAPYAVASGGGFFTGVLFAVALAAAAAGADVEGRVKGVVALPKSTAAGSAIAANKPVYWDDAAKLVTATAAGNKLIGATLKTGAADGDASVTIRLNGVAIV